MGVKEKILKDSACVLAICPVWTIGVDQWRAYTTSTVLGSLYISRSFVVFLTFSKRKARRWRHESDKTQTNWNGGWFWRFLSFRLWNGKFVCIPSEHAHNGLPLMLTEFRGEFSGLHSIFRHRALRYHVKNLRCDRWLIYKQPRQELGLWGFSFERYSGKFFCMETPCWCPSEGHQHGGRRVTEISVIEFCHWRENE